MTRFRPALVLTALLALAAADAVRADQPTRVEHDLLGDKAVPAAAYYGVQTARALENFQISGIPLSRYPDLVDGLVLTKLAAARANAAVGALPKNKAAMIERACDAVLKGAHRAAGRRADDGRPGAARVRGDARGRSRRTRRGRARALRRQHGRHRDRHRPERPERVRRRLRPRARAPAEEADRARQGSDRRD